jgi:hypothetical protein
MAAITASCQKCSKQFLVIDQEQQFLREKGLPNPVQCPACRQERRLALRGGRQLFRTKCQKCGKDIVTSYDPEKATSIILCREDYEKYNAETDLIVNEPLPDIPGAGPSTPPVQTQPVSEPTQTQMPQPEAMPQTPEPIQQVQPTQQQPEPTPQVNMSQEPQQPPQQVEQQNPQSGNIIGGSGTILGGQSGNIMGPDSNNNPSQ